MLSEETKKYLRTNKRSIEEWRNALEYFQELAEGNLNETATETWSYRNNNWAAEGEPEATDIFDFAKRKL